MQWNWTSTRKQSLSHLSPLSRSAPLGTWTWNIHSLWKLGTGSFLGLRFFLLISRSFPPGYAVNVFLLKHALIRHLVNPIRTLVLQPTQVEASRVSQWEINGTTHRSAGLSGGTLTVRAGYMLHLPVKQLVHCMFNHSWESELLTRSSGQRTMSPSCWWLALWWWSLPSHSLGILTWDWVAGSACSQTSLFEDERPSGEREP